jgi:hypothetical protein
MASIAGVFASPKRCSVRKRTFRESWRQAGAFFEKPIASKTAS